ncbi:sodium:proline symporter [Bacillus thuringiensis]|uniref:Sodium/proline symporter n=2 Tax=Bacillus TaxID=1386 RepID=Q81AD3_BACCR|nr:Sodium/proline symporter [Bacillus cereus ATCC 14579]OLR79419.1 sodium/proline symporter [Bacillus sp. MB366]OOR46980.1 sodium:proline symporter [Bacillus cereus]OTY73270.1 sodium:proline symporter [Bacillus thuringiensis serovar canadensis]OUA63448.1 sodium:proline symporter [Bacillus thuringiensis serovar bolivia]OUA81035.1 sodium:proline symporter [Bacillus thuringiensis serovar pahangi]PNK26640.1 sodium:proline symporter [Bacillus thuringiensis]TKV47952.1 sodium/proline symporter PutP
MVKIEIMVSLAIYMAGMLYIGYWSYKKTSDLSDYMLGGRGLGPAVTALSAGASDMSGWMLMGLPGAMYATGLSSVWIAIGLLIGAYANYLIIAPRLRTYTEVANDSITIPDFLENRFKDRTKILRFVSAIVILVFFTFYASAGLVSGGRLFENSFNLDYKIGLFVTVGVVVAYTLFGGFLAVSWTDFVQGCIMFIALVLVPIVAFTDVGGVTETFNTIKQVDASHLDMFKGTTVLGIISFLAWGLGYFGQPHIIVRFMAITSIKDLKTSRRIGIGWMTISIIGAMLTGLIGIAYYAKNNAILQDPEMVFVTFSNILFHPYITGFLLSAILASIMSSISSQLLVISSAVTEDFYKTFFRRNASDKELVFIGRLSVLVVAMIAVVLAYHPSDTILTLVGYAWAGFGSAFGPAILLSLYWKRTNKWGVLAGMIVGAVVVIAWVQIPSLKAIMYEMVPGFFCSLLTVIVVSLLTKEPVKAVHREFNEMEAVLEEETK